MTQDIEKLEAAIRTVTDSQPYVNSSYVRDIVFAARAHLEHLKAQAATDEG